ncbi:LTA synthase family protein [Schleiferilactobacillus perolens]|uniref:Phosphatidylglycerol--membrane-oligosaccharide glycerophosphotransferase n=1 Tax=Schleiferilactobacillus perolens DSM 12744 TaxID=1423792 RepID=A0A0R1MJG0_9LACO|nr:LTA synthase family protein [Schleiferilactobacillus perolens]KRL08076.1 phosphatidylglycerol--membrane-oligosaccharide glycerophosphotransferase [Schleiferilactobacillus perolens DSM 12744]
MKNALQATRRFLNSRWGFFLLAVVLFWAKTVYAYTTKFNLGVKGSMQFLLLMLNPLPTTILLFGVALYLKGRKSYIVMVIIDLLTSIWLFANVLYYREFSDFLGINLIKGSGAVSNNLGGSIMGIVKGSDFLVFLDVAVLILLLAFKVIRVDIRPLKLRYAMTVTAFALALFGLNLSMAQNDRSGLLTRTFDNNYIVKYLGLNAYSVYDSVKAAQTSAVRAKADSSDMKSVLKYLKTSRLAPNSQYFGKAKGKNIIVIHLESFQQFLIDFKWDGQEVTPNLNKIYHDNNTLSFSNFFHQVGTGKTADAEMMMENSLFGLPEGPAMVQYGTTNTFQAAPAILDQKGYTTAAFHGDVPSFWNRENTYKSWGYDFFFSTNYLPKKASYMENYGMKDKIFMMESANYLQRLPQPFYAKLITVTNHYPYPLDKANQTIPKTDTGDNTVDGYVQTAHYLDQSIGEFMAWLKDSGMEKNTMVVFYGDHYGISANHKKAMAKLTGKENFGNYENAMYQRVPFMIHMDGLQGGVKTTYGGEIDALPTILDLAGVQNTDTVQFGQDLLADNRNQIVPFRNGDFVTPQYTKVGSTYYNTQDGKQLKLTDAQKQDVEKINNHVQTQLSFSDKVITGDLLRFYKPDWFKKVVKSDYNYNRKKGDALLKKLQKESPTSMFQKNNDKSLLNLYKTDAPELKNASNYSEELASSDYSQANASSSSSSDSDSSSSSSASSSSK